MKNEMIPLTIANTLDQSAKQRVEAKPNQTLKNVVQRHDLAPKGNYDIYDREGKVISNEQAQNYREATVYVGVSKIAGGGISMQDFRQIQAIDFPSMRQINKFTTTESVYAFVVVLDGVYSYSDDSIVHYQVVVDLREFPECPRAYVISPQCVDIQHSNIFRASTTLTIRPNKPMCEICIGSGFKALWPTISHSPLMKLGIFLDQVIHVLKHPNPDDPARVVE
jgi:hypothetical protein